jgi:hypothetical protein
MATLLNNRNQFLSTATERATGLSATITFTTGNTFTLSAQGNTATPSSITMQATAFNFTNPSYLWYRKIGTGNFILIANSSLSSLSVLGDTNFLLDVGAETYVQYKVIISEGSSTTIKKEAIAIVQVVRQGSSSVLGVLSNDSALVPTDSSGNNPIFTQASTTFSVYNGTVDDSANWTVTVEYDTVNLTVTGTNSGRTQTVSRMNATTAVITFTAARSGYSSITKKFTLFKVKAGIDSSSYWLTSSVDVLKQSTSKVYSPTSIVFSAYKATGSATPALYAGKFKIYENGSATAIYTTVDTESSYVRTPSANTVTSIKAELYLSDGTTKIDEQTIAVITDGNDAIVGTLTNETSVLPANTDGSVISVVGASTTLKIYKGIVDDTSNWTINTTKSNVTVNTSANSATQTITGLSADTGSITFTATRSGYSDITKTYTITKSKSGAAGSSVTAYSVEPSVQVIVKKIDNTLNPVTLDIVAYSTTGATKSLFTTAKLKIYENTTLKADTVSVNSTTALYTYTPSATAYQASTIKVEMYNGTTLVDSQTIPILVAASSGINISVSNQTVSLPSSIVGIVSSYSGSGTDIVVSEGENILTYLTTLTGTAGTFTVGTPTLSIGGSIIVGNLTGNNTTTAKVGNHSNMAQLVDSVTITYPITYIRLNGAQATENVSQSVIKVKSGADGIRGSVRELVSGYSSWTNAAATVTTLFNSRYGGVVISDSVTVYDGFGFSETRSWNGTDWIKVTQFVDGNLLVAGTITSDKLSTNFVTVGQKIYSTDNKFVIDMVNKYISISV